MTESISSCKNAYEWDNQMDKFKGLSVYYIHLNKERVGYKDEWTTYEYFRSKSKSLCCKPHSSSPLHHLDRQLWFVRGYSYYLSEANPNFIWRSLNCSR